MEVGINESNTLPNINYKLANVDAVIKHFI